jgi:hypothetical protein
MTSHTMRTTAPVGALGAIVPQWAGPTRLTPRRPAPKRVRRLVRRTPIKWPDALGD